MRIVHISDCFAPRTGGIETQVGDLAATQAAAGDDVHVFTATAGRVQGWVEDWRGVHVHRMDSRLMLGVPINPFAPPRMRQALTDLAPDVVHVHAGVVSPFAYDGARISRRLALPMVITWHCMLDGAVVPLRWGAGALGWDRTPMVLSAVSRVAADRVGAVFGRDVRVLPNAIDVAAWRPAEAKVPHSPLAVVATMRLAPRKRGAALVRLFADAVAAAGPDSMRLTVIGAGPDRPRMAAAAERAGIVHLVEFLGRLPRDEVRVQYADQDVFAAPTELEAFGIAALEARAAGLVVVGRSGNGLSEFITDGVDGFLADDDAGMAEALVRLAAPGRPSGGPGGSSGPAGSGGTGGSGGPAASGGPGGDESLAARMLAHTSTVPPDLDWGHAYAAADALYREAIAGR